MRDIRRLEVIQTQAMADEMADLIRIAVKGGKTPPPNKPSTIKAKGHDKTLVDTGETSDAIEAKVIIDPKEDIVSGVIGVPDGASMDKYLWNEFGVPYSDSLEPQPGQRIPSRAAWRKTFDKHEEVLLAKHSGILLDNIMKEFGFR